jgi:carboxylesterase type B
MPRWSAFNAADRPTMVFNTESRVVNDPIKEQRLMMWKALGYDS